jgi:hypothetical protein
MFLWYKNAAVCYAYLSDVIEEDSISLHNEGSTFRESKWFTRGWTLQELLAPVAVIFFNWSWIDIGTKACLAGLIGDITGIKDLFKFEDASVAQKMSWSSHRETTRVEDMA